MSGVVLRVEQGNAISWYLQKHTEESRMSFYRRGQQAQLEVGGGQGGNFLTRVAERKGNLAELD